MAQVLQGFHEAGMPVLPRLAWGVLLFPAAQEMVIIGQRPEAPPLHAPEALFLGFPAQAWSYRLFFVSPVLIGDGKVLRQREGGFLAAGSMQPGNEVNHIPGGSAAEAVEAAVSLHAWVSVVVERADAHPVPVHLDSVMLHSLPCGDGLLHGFK